SVTRALREASFKRLVRSHLGSCVSPNPSPTILQVSGPMAEIAALAPYSWHDPSSHGVAQYDKRWPMYKDSKNVVSFVDGHVDYIKMYYEHPVAACLTNPPASYDYQWTPD